MEEEIVFLNPCSSFFVFSLPTLKFLYSMMFNRVMYPFLLLHMLHIYLSKFRLVTIYNAAVHFSFIWIQVLKVDLIKWIIFNILVRLQISRWRNPPSILKPLTNIVFSARSQLKSLITRLSLIIIHL